LQSNHVCGPFAVIFTEGIKYPSLTNSACGNWEMVHFIYSSRSYG